MASTHPPVLNHRRRSSRSSRRRRRGLPTRRRRLLRVGGARSGRGGLRGLHMIDWNPVEDPREVILGALESEMMHRHGRRAELANELTGGETRLGYATAYTRTGGAECPEHDHVL